MLRNASKGGGGLKPSRKVKAGLAPGEGANVLQNCQNSDIQFRQFSLRYVRTVISEMAFQVTWGKGGMSTTQMGGITAAMLDEAQRTGNMNLVARGLEEICEDILGINERKGQEGVVSFAEMDTGVKWYERVPVTVLMLNSNSIKKVSYLTIELSL